MTQLPPAPRRGLPPIAIVGIVIGGVVILVCGGLLALGALGAAMGERPRTSGGVGLSSPTTAPAGDVLNSDSPSQPTQPAAPAPTTSTTATIVLPADLVGQNALIARDRLKELGFKNVNFASADTNDTMVLLPQNWHVVKVEPAPGTAVLATATIVLTCSKAAT